MYRVYKNPAIREPIPKPRFNPKYINENIYKLADINYYFVDYQNIYITNTSTAFHYTRLV